MSIGCAAGQVNYSPTHLLARIVRKIAFPQAIGPRKAGKHFRHNERQPRFFFGLATLRWKPSVVLSRFKSAKHLPLLGFSGTSNHFTWDYVYLALCT